MRTVDERVAAVRSRSRRLRRTRADRALAAFVCFAAIPLAVLAGKVAMDGLPMSTEVGGGLFGAASVFGPSAGGYVIVALSTAVIVAMVTIACMKRRKDDGKKGDPADGDDGKKGGSADGDDGKGV